jgi:hypothetical protein
MQFATEELQEFYVEFEEEFTLFQDLQEHVGSN